jgi:hypothetical protein
LQDYAKQYYKYLAKRVYIPGSDKRELFEINRMNADETEISVYKIKKNNEKELLFSRTFNRKESDEIFLYGFKGDDIYNISGSSKEGVKIRIIGVTKSDTVIHDIPEWNRATKIYRGKNTEFDTVFNTVRYWAIFFYYPSAYKFSMKIPFNFLLALV